MITVTTTNINGNSFNTNCYHNTFGNCCTYINVQKDYVYYIIVENGNQYITLTSTHTTSYTSKLRNITILTKYTQFQFTQ